MAGAESRYFLRITGHPLGDIDGSFHLTPLEGRYSRIYYGGQKSEQCSASDTLLGLGVYLFNCNLSLLKSVSLALFGFVFTYKIWWKLYDRPNSWLYGSLLFLGTAC